MSDAVIAARDAEMARDELKYGEAAQRQAEVEEIAAAFDAAHAFHRISDLLGNPEDPEQVVRLLVRAAPFALAYLDYESNELGEDGEPSNHADNCIQLASQLREHVR